MLLNAAKYRSQFGGLWTDMANAHEEVQARLDRGWIDREQAELLNFWIDKGYVIIPNAVPHDAIDRTVDFIEKAWESLDSHLKVESIFQDGCNYSISHYILSMEEFLDAVTLNSIESSGLEVSPNSEILSVEVEKLRNEVKLLQSMVEAMQSSKFWQMRRAWFKVKRALGFKANE